MPQLADGFDDREDSASAWMIGRQSTTVGVDRYRSPWSDGTARDELACFTSFAKPRSSSAIIGVKVLASYNCATSTSSRVRPACSNAARQTRRRARAADERVGLVEPLLVDRLAESE